MVSSRSCFFAGLGGIERGRVNILLPNQFGTVLVGAIAARKRWVFTQFLSSEPSILRTEVIR